MAKELTEWQKDFALKDELTQADFEALEDAVTKFPKGLLLRSAGSQLSHGAMLRAAIRAGWIVSPECRALVDERSHEAAYFYNGKDVDEMHPAVVKWLGEQVNARYMSILSDVPKNL